MGFPELREPTGGTSETSNTLTPFMDSKSEGSRSAQRGGRTGGVRVARFKGYRSSRRVVKGYFTEARVATL